MTLRTPTQKRVCLLAENILKFPCANLKSMVPELILKILNKTWKKQNLGEILQGEMSRGEMSVREKCLLASMITLQL